MSHFLIISTNTDLICVAQDRFAYAISEGNYASIIFTDGGKQFVTCQLGHIETLINEQLNDNNNNFIRIGRSLIINRKYIHYINPTKQQLILADGIHPRHTLSASKKALQQLKEFIEQAKTTPT